MKYLVIFETPVDGGWGVRQQEAMAVVEAEDGSFSMPYGWMPQEIGGVPVSAVTYIIPFTDTIEVISGEYDKAIPLVLDDEVAVLIDEATMNLDEIA